MKKIFANKKLLFMSYGVIFALYVLVLFLAKVIGLTPWSIIIIFAGVLIVPGFGLARILKINFEDDRLGQLILWLALGLAASLSVCLLAIFTGMSIILINNIYPYLIALVLVVALALDLIRKAPEEKKLEFNWKNIFTFKNIVYLILIALGLAGVLMVAVQETLFHGGDPNFHLSILRKAFEGSPLTPGNLGFTKSEKIHIAYGTPIWHVFMALLAKFTQVDALILWKSLAGAMSFTALFVWYWLFNKILKNQFLAVFSLFFFLMFLFNQSYGYFFTCLPLPDTLATYFLLPLVISLALKYIFDKNMSYKLLISVALLVILMAIIHLTQYFYFLIMIGITGALWLIFQRKHEDFKIVLKKIGWMLFASALVFTPFLIILEIKGHIISDILKSAMAAPPRDLRYWKFVKWTIFAKYAYLLSPLMLVFIRKNHRLTFLVALMAITPILYYPPLSRLVMKVMDFIFLNRLIGSITWHFIVLGLIYGFVILLVAKAVISLKSKVWSIIVNSVIGLATIIFVWTEFKYQLAGKIFNFFFSKLAETFMANHVYWILAIIVLITFMILFLQRRFKKFDDLFELEEPKNWFVPLCAIVMATTIFLATTHPVQWTFVGFGLKKEFLGAKVTFENLKSGDNQQKTATVNSGGQDLVDFVKNELPHKQIFMVPGTTIYIFPILLDQHMAAYFRTESFSDYSKIYEGKYDLKEKLRQISRGKIQYILLNRPEPQGKAFFDKYPQYFEAVFVGERSMLYKVLPQAKIDYEAMKQSTN